MNVTNIIFQCQKLGVALSSDGETLRATPASALVSELRAAISENKQALMLTLHAVKFFESSVISEAIYDQFREVVRVHYTDADTDTRIQAAVSCLLTILTMDGLAYRPKAHAAYCWWRLEETCEALHIKRGAKQ